MSHIQIADLSASHLSLLLQSTERNGTSQHNLSALS